MLFQDLDIPNDDGAEGPGHDDEAWQSILLKILGDNNEMSPSEVIQKRKQLTFAAFRDPQMVAKAIAVEELIGPNIHRMYQLFARSSAVASLQRLPKSEKERTMHEQKFPS